jgi:hypothetical protein
MINLCELSLMSFISSIICMADPFRVSNTRIGRSFHVKRRSSRVHGACGRALELLGDDDGRIIRNLGCMVPL